MEKKIVIFFSLKMLFFCELFLTKKGISEVPQHLENKRVLSIPKSGNFIPSLSNKDRNDLKLHEIQIKNQKDLLDRLNNNAVYCDIKIDDIKKKKYKLRIKLNKTYKNKTLEFIGDEKQVIFNRIFDNNKKH